MKTKVLALTLALMGAFGLTAAAQQQSTTCPNQTTCVKSKDCKKDCKKDDCKQDCKKECKKKDCKKQDCKKQDCKKQDCKKQDCKKQDGMKKDCKKQDCKKNAVKRNDAPGANNKMYQPQQFTDFAFEGILLTVDQQDKINQINQDYTQNCKQSKCQKDSADCQTPRVARNQARKDYVTAVKEVLTPDQYVTFLENIVMMPDNHSHARPPKREGKMGSKGFKAKNRGSYEMEQPMRPTPMPKSNF